MTTSEFLAACAKGTGGVYGLPTHVVAWVDEKCKPKFPIFKGVGATAEEAISNLKPKEA